MFDDIQELTQRAAFLSACFEEKSSMPLFLFTSMTLLWFCVGQFFLFFLSCLLWSASGCRSGQKTLNAYTEAVFPDNTSIKSQGKIDFCWAYAAVGMIDADLKKRTGREIDLSEEAIGLPLVPVRQFVVTFPVQLRLWMAR